MSRDQMSSLSPARTLSEKDENHITDVDSCSDSLVETRQKRKSKPRKSNYSPEPAATASGKATQPAAKKIKTSHDPSTNRNQVVSATREKSAPLIPIGRKEEKLTTTPPTKPKTGSTTNLVPLFHLFPTVAKNGQLMYPTEDRPITDDELHLCLTRFIFTKWKSAEIIPDDVVTKGGPQWLKTLDASQILRCLTILRHQGLVVRKDIVLNGNCGKDRIVHLKKEWKDVAAPDREIVDRLYGLSVF